MRSNYDITVGSVSCSATRIPIVFHRMAGSDQIRSGPVSDSSTWAVHVIHHECPIEIYICRENERSLRVTVR